MDQFSSARNYVAQRRLQGASDQQITQELQGNGWDQVSINQLLSEKPGKAKLGAGILANQKVQFAGLIIGGLMLFGLLVFLFTAGGRTPVTTDVVVTDTYYSIGLPEGWGPQEGYKPGAAAVNFSMPGEPADITTLASVQRQAVDGRNITDPIQAQKDLLESAGLTVNTIREEPIEREDGTRGHLVEWAVNAEVSAPENAVAPYNILMTTFIAGDQFFFVDVKSLATEWEALAPTAQAIVDSFQPNVQALSQLAEPED